MLGIEILDVAIGLVFVFLLVSIMVTAVREAIEHFCKARAAHLEVAIREMLWDKGGSGVAKAIYEHPLIFSLFRGGYKPITSAQPGAFTKGGDLPSYIPSRSFASALMDIAARGADTNKANSGPKSTRLTAETIRANIRNIENDNVQRVLLNALDTARDDLDEARKELESWFDTAMDRVSGQYKRASQQVIFLVAFGMAVVLNVDSIQIAERLYQDAPTRDAIVARVESAVGDPAFMEQTYNTARADLQSLGLPIGGLQARFRNPTWPAVGWEVGLALIGWLVTAFAATLGAPFWFDILKKFMEIRSTVKPRERKPVKDTEDQATTPPPAVVPAFPQPAAPAQAPVAVPVPAPAFAFDDDDDLEGCGVLVGVTTLDEQLPAAKGGVA